MAPEPIDEWVRNPVSGESESGLSALGELYASPRHNAMGFQVLVASSKVRDLREKLEASGGRGEPLVCERDPYDEDIFPAMSVRNGHLSRLEARSLRHLLETLRVTSGVPRVAGHIYLRADPELCLLRAKKRGRPEESGLDVSMLKDLHEAHESKFGERAGSSDRVLVLDAKKDSNSHLQEVRKFVSRIAVLDAP